MTSSDPPWFLTQLSFLVVALLTQAQTRIPFADRQLLPMKNVGRIEPIGDDRELSNP
jgi:hypothetical protein